MTSKKTLITLGVLLGIIFLVMGYVYMSRSAENLPHFFPGYLAGDNLKHTKHALAAFIAGIACLIYAWFQSGPKTQNSTI